VIKKYWKIALPIILLGAGYFYFFIDVNKFGLGVLTTLKTIKGESVNLDAMKHADQSHDHSVWDGLLQKHVSDKGSVDYEGFIKDHDLLIQYLDHLSIGSPNPAKSQEEHLAYWINAYNAFTVKLIIDHWPLKSIKDIGGNIPMIDSPWSIKFFKIGGVDFDLDTIEHEILRKKFVEPRIHFAIVCASMSCPTLLNQAFVPTELESQLDSQTRAFINDSSKNRISDKSMALSQIFEWFKMDFSEQGNLRKYIEPYTTVNLPEGDIEFIEYDWSLNM